MLRTRVIPCLLLRNDALVKTVKFRKFRYIGDPANTVRIFNELEVDELAVLDILASRKKQPISFKVLQEISNEAFMPLSYGGGIREFDDAKKILAIGFEKLIINSYAVENNDFVVKLSEHFGSQSVIGSIDIKKNLFGINKVVTNNASKITNLDPVEWAAKLENLGAGELLVTSVDNDGTWKGYDYDIVKRISESVSIPVIANGGAGNTKHIADAVKLGRASAVGLGSMVVYQKKGMGVLVNFPDKNELINMLN